MLAQDDFVFQRREFWIDDSENKLGCTYYYSKNLSGTLMSVDSPVGRVPEEMKIFYLKELVGKVSKPSKKELTDFNNLRLILEKEVPSPEYFCSANDER